jgi:hypothetical protein
VLQLPGWDTSKGVAAEIEAAHARGMRVYALPLKAEATEKAA